MPHCPECQPIHQLLLPVLLARLGFPIFQFGKPVLHDWVLSTLCSSVHLYTARTLTAHMTSYDLPLSHLASASRTSYAHACPKFLTIALQTQP